MMSALKAYLHFTHHFNPSHIFTEKEREFLYRGFKDLKTFVEGLCGKESHKISAYFADVFNGNIFYYQGSRYEKINETTGRKFSGHERREFLKLTNVYLKRGRPHLKSLVFFNIMERKVL